MSLFPPTWSLVIVISAVSDPLPDRFPRNAGGKLLMSPKALSKKIVKRTFDTNAPSSG
jgi:hypothetical protein